MPESRFPEFRLQAVIFCRLPSSAPIVKNSASYVSRAVLSIRGSVKRQKKGEPKLP